MTKMNKNQNLGFKAYYDQLDTNQRLSIRDQFIAETEVALPTFYNKKENPSRFTKLERDILSRITDKEIDFLFPK